MIAKQVEEGDEEVPASSSPTIASDGSTTLDNECSLLPVVVNRNSNSVEASTLLPVRDLCLDDSCSNKTLNSWTEHSTITGAASTNCNANVLDAKHWAARSVVRKKQQNQHSLEHDKEGSVEEFSAISQGTADTTDTLDLSPSAGFVQGKRSVQDDSHDSSELEHGTEDHYQTSALVVMTRWVEDDSVVQRTILDERGERGLESRLREANIHHPTTTVIAEALVPVNTTSEHDHEPTMSLNPTIPNETPSHKVVGGRRPRTLFGLFALVVVMVAVVVACVFALQAFPSQVAHKLPESPAVAPIASRHPNDSRRIQVLQRIESWIIRNDQDRILLEDDPASPQSRALDWLSADRTNLSEDRPPSIVLERYVLAVLYYSTDGPNWVMEDYDFLSAMDVCSWNNNKEWDDPGALGILCLNQSNVVELLRLNQEGLSGTIPWELSLLSHLLSVRLPENDLIGTIPTELGDLSRLQSISLGSNRLQGTIPSEIRRLTNLVWLDVSRNSITGTLPSELGHLTNIETLLAFSNTLNGTIPTEFSALSHIHRFSVQQNDLQGTIPTFLGLLTTIEDFRISNNKFTGTLPTELGKLTDVIFLSVKDNALTGTLPTELGQLHKFQSLRLDDNFLMGTLPTELGRLTLLEMFHVEMNGFTGTLPTVLGELKHLKEFVFHKNNFTGSANAVLCEATMQWETLQGDCLPMDSTIEIECQCCSICCNVDGEDCHKMILNSHDL